MNCNNMESLLNEILSFNVDEMNVVLDSVRKRYAELEPESEMVCLFLPKNDLEERERILTQSMQFLKLS